jgi:hypothetical protein
MAITRLGAAATQTPLMIEIRLYECSYLCADPKGDKRQHRDLHHT